MYPNRDVYEVDGAGSEREWDLGVTQYICEETSADMRCCDGSENLGSYFGLSLTWDSVLFGG